MPIEFFMLNVGIWVFSIIYIVSYLIFMRHSIKNCFKPMRNQELDIDRITITIAIVSFIVTSVIGFYSFRIVWNHSELISTVTLLGWIVFNILLVVFCLCATHPRTGCFSYRAHKIIRKGKELEEKFKESDKSARLRIPQNF
jgi:small-conductance mechanosensitive channel